MMKQHLVYSYYQIYCTLIRRKRIILLRHYGIWWIVLLLYTQLVHTSLSILECPFLSNYELPVSRERIPLRASMLNQHNCVSLQRWFVSGGIKCFTGWHIPLALLAIVVLIVTILFAAIAGIISMKHRLIKVRIIII